MFEARGWEGTEAARGGELRYEFLRMPGRDIVRLGEVVVREDGEGIPLGRFGMSACSEAIEVGEICVMVGLSEMGFDFLNGKEFYSCPYIGKMLGFIRSQSQGAGGVLITIVVQAEHVR